MEELNIQSILYIILLISAIALCISLIIYLNRITKSIQNIEENVDELSTKAKPLIGKITEVNTKFNDIADNVKEQMDVVESVVHDFRDRADEILEFEENIRREVEKPVGNLVNSLAAISNGVNTFWKTYKNKH